MTRPTGGHIFIVTEEFSKKGGQNMFEKLDRIRAEEERMKQRVEEDTKKLEKITKKRQEAERDQIMLNVNELNLTPEKLKMLLDMVANGAVDLGALSETGKKEDGTGKKTKAEEQEDELEDLSFMDVEDPEEEYEDAQEDDF
jgi:hypothetical protein